MNIRFFPTILFTYLSFMIVANVKAQNPTVKYITISVVKNDTIVMHLDTFKLFYSNNRGGVALPEPQSTLYHYEDLAKQPLYYDSMISIATQAPVKQSIYKTYDTGNNILSYLRNFGTISQNWTTYTYNNNGQLVCKIDSMTAGGTLSGGSMDSMVYNNNGQLITHIRTGISGGVWINLDRYDYTYSGTNLTEIAFAQWINGINAYRMSNKTKNFYTAGNLDSTYKYTYYYGNPGTIRLSRNYHYYSGTRLDSIIQHYYKDTTTIKYEKSKQTFKYNVNQLVTEHNQLTWDTVGNKWTNNIREVRSYNSTNSIDTSVELLWNTNTNSFMNRLRNLYYHDANHFFTYKILQNHVSGKWGHDISGALSDSVHMYHYDTIIAPTAIVKTQSPIIKSVKLFPNPATSFINIDLGTNNKAPQKIAIYDMRGSLQMQIVQKHNGVVQIPVAGLDNGNYLLIVSGEGSQASTQFTLLK